MGGFIKVVDVSPSGKFQTIDICSIVTCYDGGFTHNSMGKAIMAKTLDNFLLVKQGNVDRVVGENEIVLEFTVGELVQKIDNTSTLTLFDQAKEQWRRDWKFNEAREEWHKDRFPDYGKVEDQIGSSTNDGKLSERVGSIEIKPLPYYYKLTEAGFRHLLYVRDWINNYKEAGGVMGLVKGDAVPETLIPDTAGKTLRELII